MTGKCCIGILYYHNGNVCIYVLLRTLSTAIENCVVSLSYWEWTECIPLIMREENDFHTNAGLCFLELRSFTPVGTCQSHLEDVEESEENTIRVTFCALLLLDGLTVLQRFSRCSRCFWICCSSSSILSRSSDCALSCSERASIVVISVVLVLLHWCKH